jgi:hypothetical protein
MPLLGKPRRLVFTLLALQLICGARACDGSELRRVEVSQSTAHEEATLDIGDLIASGAVEPASAIRANDQTDGWLLRTPKGPDRLRWYRNLLNAGPGAPDLTIDLKLKGVWDVYVQVRAVNGAAQDGLPMAFEFRLDDGSRREVVGAKGFPEYHYDTEILACHRWPMDGRKLVLHSLGKLLMTYGYRRPPWGIRACLSNDQGKTWDLDNEIILRMDGGTPEGQARKVIDADLGYPVSVELADGSVFTVYYHNTAGTNCFIAGTFWKPPNR